MATVKFYLDLRREKKDGVYPLKLSINNKDKGFYISLGVNLKPQHWDSALQKVILAPNKRELNFFLEGYKHKVEASLRSLRLEGGLDSLRAKDLKTELLKTLSPEKYKEKEREKGVAYNFRMFIETRFSTTQGIYRVSYKHLKNFVGEEELSTLSFEEIDKAWLLRFDSYLKGIGLSQNSRNIHLSHLKAVFNDAIDGGITQNYPFRRFPLHKLATKPRALTVDELRKIIKVKLPPKDAIHRDMFLLIFMLIGINIADMFRLKEITHDGRIEYYRAKTHKFYSIKVEKEALEIINRWHGKHTLLKISEKYHNNLSYTKIINYHLKIIAKKIGVTVPLSAYWARHTWATIASELDIPLDVISHSLGHSPSIASRITEVYIKYNRDKIDNANRKVLDYVLYNVGF